MMERITGFFGRYQGTVFVVALALFSGLCLYLGFAYFRELSVFAVAIALFTTLMVIFFLFDKFILRGYDTISTLYENPVAVGLALIALAILFHAVTSFV